MPCSATHTADSRVPDPHQILSTSPGDCGCTASMDPPGLPPISPATTPAPEIAFRKRAVLSRASLDSTGYPNPSAPCHPAPGEPRPTPTSTRPPPHQPPT